MQCILWIGVWISYRFCSCSFMSLAVIRVVDFITIWSIISTSLFLSTNFMLSFDVLTLILSLYFIFFRRLYRTFLLILNSELMQRTSAPFSITLVIRKFLWYSSSFLHFSSHARSCQYCNLWKLLQV